MSSPQLALQVYTVRESLGEDFSGTLGKIKQIGYDAVELVSKGPYGDAELREVLDGLGLTAAAMHVGLSALEEDADGCIQMAHALEMEHLVCSGPPEERRQTGEDWVKLAGIMDGIGRRCREEGVRFSYHNHSFEFERFDGPYGLDILFANCSAENVLSELDTYWVAHGGADPVEYINRYAGRIAILHCKDMAGDEARSFAEVGNGILDWQAIHQAAMRAGVQWYCVEQDVCKGDPFESARVSLEFIRGELGV